MSHVEISTVDEQGHRQDGWIYAAFWIGESVECDASAPTVEGALLLLLSALGDSIRSAEGEQT